MLLTATLLVPFATLQEPTLQEPVPFDVLAEALASEVVNLEAAVPPPCYTATGGVSNACWVCHTDGVSPNVQNDAELQLEYAFSDFALTNRWSGLFADRREAAAAIDDETIDAYIDQDNYRDLRAALEGREDYPGYVPDLDLDAGFDELGFARDGSAWRALRYKPFPGMFWPTNGGVGDVFVRLPEAYRTRNGEPDLLTYRANLSILEASIAAPPPAGDAALDYPIEPLDEEALGLDLDGDGEVRGLAERLHTLPSHYVGDASDREVTVRLYPKGVEFLHTVRYVDLDAPGLLSTRLKELRYSRKDLAPDLASTLLLYEMDYEHKERGRTPVYRGEPTIGLGNGFGWRLQGFIEDAEGRLRLQTHDEHRSCMGCHGALGITIDQTFSLARKVPGLDGWRHQTLAGMPDAPQVGHDQPETLVYFERVRGGDELRANDEMLERYFDAEGNVHADRVLAAPDLAALLTPSPERARQLNKVYRVIVQEQDYEQGRIPLTRPAEFVHKQIEETDAGLAAAGHTFRDGRLWLEWIK